MGSIVLGLCGVMDTPWMSEAVREIEEFDGIVRPIICAVIGCITVYRVMYPGVDNFLNSA